MVAFLRGGFMCPPVSLDILEVAINFVVVFPYGG